MVLQRQKQVVSVSGSWRQRVVRLEAWCVRVCVCERERERERESDRQTDRQTGRQTGRQKQEIVRKDM